MHVPTWKTMVLQPLTPSQHLSHIVLTHLLVFFSPNLEQQVLFHESWIYTQLHLFSVVKYLSQRSTMRVNIIEALIDNNLISGRTA